MNGWFTNQLARHVADTQVIIIFCVTTTTSPIPTTRFHFLNDDSALHFTCLFLVIALRMQFAHFKLLLTQSFSLLPFWSVVDLRVSIDLLFFYLGQIFSLF
jgi:hypothetical protein